MSFSSRRWLRSCSSVSPKAVGRNSAARGNRRRLWCVELLEARCLLAPVGPIENPTPSPSAEVLTDTTSATSYAVLEGNATGDRVLMTFTDSNPAAWATDFGTPAVNWGGAVAGTPTAGVQMVGRSEAGSTWEVVGNATYLEDGDFPVTVTAQRGADGPTASTSQTSFVIIDAPLTDTTPRNAPPIPAVEGNSTGNITLATFSDANPGANASDFLATVNWGATTAQASLPEVQLVGRSNTTSTWRVVSQATYAEEGTYQVSAQVVDVDGSSVQTAKQTVNVVDGSLTATGLNLAPATGLAFSNVPVAQFTDANPGAQPSDFRAAITWDSATQAASPGTVIATSTKNGIVFLVLGSHEYDTEGNHTITVSVTDAGGQNVTADATAAVQVAEPTALDVETIDKNARTGMASAHSLDPSAPSAVLALLRPAGENKQATLALATFKNPNQVPGSNTNLPPPPPKTEAAVFLDVRATGMTSEDSLTLVINVPPDQPMPGPNDVYTYTTTSGWVHVHGSTKVPNSVQIDVQNRTVTILLDDTSTPKITDLTGTIFAINVPVANSSTTTVASPVVLEPSVLSPTSDTGSSLSEASTFQTTSGITLTLTSSQESQLTANQAGLATSATSSSTGAGVRESNTTLADDAAQLLWQNRDDDMLPPDEKIVAGVPGETGAQEQVLPALTGPAADTLFASATSPPLGTNEPESVPAEQPRGEHVPQPVGQPWVLAVAMLGVPLVPRWREEESRRGWKRRESGR